MKRVFLLDAAAAAVLAAAAGGVCAQVQPQGFDPGVVRARAVIEGPGGIRGVVVFRQPRCIGCPSPGLGAAPTDPGFRNFPEPTVEVVARISGPANVLTPGAHGIHLHQTGVCAAPFTSAGGHFDPGPFGETQPDANHPFHMGDLPNLIVNSQGRGFLRHTTSRITLSPGPLSVFDTDGTAVIVHLNPDRGITGSPAASGGPRIACGVVVPVQPGEVDEFEEE